MLCLQQPAHGAPRTVFEEYVAVAGAVRRAEILDNVIVLQVTHELDFALETRRRLGIPRDDQLRRKFHRSGLITDVINLSRRSDTNPLAAQPLAVDDAAARESQ